MQLTAEEHWRVRDRVLSCCFPLNDLRCLMKEWMKERIRKEDMSMSTEISITVRKTVFVRRDRQRSWNSSTEYNRRHFKREVTEMVRRKKLIASGNSYLKGTACLHPTISRLHEAIYVHLSSARPAIASRCAPCPQNRLVQVGGKYDACFSSTI